MNELRERTDTPNRAKETTYSLCIMTLSQTYENQVNLRYILGKAYN